LWSLSPPSPSRIDSVLRLRGGLVLTLFWSLPYVLGSWFFYSSQIILPRCPICKVNSFMCTFSFALNFRTLMKQFPDSPSSDLGRLRPYIVMSFPGGSVCSPDSFEAQWLWERFPPLDRTFRLSGTTVISEALLCPEFHSRFSFLVTICRVINPCSLFLLSLIFFRMEKVISLSFSFLEFGGLPFLGPLGFLPYEVISIDPSPPNSSSLLSMAQLSPPFTNLMVCWSAHQLPSFFFFFGSSSQFLFGHPAIGPAKSQEEF